MDNKKVNALCVTPVVKTSIGAINGSWSEGNVITVKKITALNGDSYPYVSGQSLKYGFRRALEELGEKLSELNVPEKKKGVASSLGKPDYIDDDLFGFMIAGTENRRRTAPVRITPAIACAPFRGDRDLGTKSKETVEGSMEAGGNIFETEVYYNFFVSTMLVELDRIGVFQHYELSKEDAKDGKEPFVQEHGKRQERLYKLLQAQKILWGGGKQSRLLTDLTPKFLAIAILQAKVPLFLETVRVNEDEELMIEPIVESIKDYQHILLRDASNMTGLYFGLRRGIFKNEEEIRSTLSEFGSVVPVNEAIDNAWTRLKELEW